MESSKNFDFKSRPVSPKEMSNAQIDKLGEELRSAIRHNNFSREPLNKLFLLQSLHSFPTDQVRAFLEEVASDKPAEISNRIKTVQAILAKLDRQPSLRLSQMQDIGGCRLVTSDLESLDDLQRKVHNHLLADTQILATRDYISSPKITGYRALHIIIAISGIKVEVQLRTSRQMIWAQLVEGLEQTGEHELAKYRAMDVLKELANQLAEEDHKNKNLTNEEIEMIRKTKKLLQQ